MCSIQYPYYFLSDAKVTPKPAVNVTKKTTNGVSSAKKPPSPANLVDDFSALFGGRSCDNMSFPGNWLLCANFLGNVSLSTEDPIFKEFEEIPGETEERRKARWDREQRTKSRVVCSGHFCLLLNSLVWCYLYSFSYVADDDI